jgi:hypothetical protein
VIPTLELKITVPDGTTINITGLEDAITLADTTTDEDPSERYWRHYLSDNTRKLLAAAARLQRSTGLYTLEDIADDLGISYESVRSHKQTLGRPARKWKEDTGTVEPIKLQYQNYQDAGAGQGMRTVYCLPDGMADTISALAANFMIQPLGEG